MIPGYSAGVEKYFSARGEEVILYVQGKLVFSDKV